MLTLIRRLGRSSAMALFAACFLIEVAGCSSRDLQPSDMAGVQSQTLPAGVKKPQAPQKIYITTYNRNFVAIYNEDGTLTSEIRDGVRRPAGVAVDTYGNVYIANTGDNTVTTYNRDGGRTKPTIRTSYPLDLTVDANGRIYVLGGMGLVTYNPNGSPTNIPPIVDQQRGEFESVAVDTSGKIYLAQTRTHLTRRGPYGSGVSYHSFVTTYDPTGSPSTPTINIGWGVRQIVRGLAVDANGKIYVATNGGMVRTYTSSGSPTTPTISLKMYGAFGVAVGANGKIYVTSYLAGHVGTLTTYNPDGSQTTPTITGLAQPFGVAVH